MKALILAAGLGTRLKPHTENIPKPLFTIAGRPLLDIIISNLIHAGCEAVMVNTHHLHQKIESHLFRQRYAVPVMTRHEPEILGTGGAIKNVADFWDNSPFMVINSDIATDIDLKRVYEFHLNHPHPATLVLHNDPDFNTVTVDKNGFVQNFDPLIPVNEPPLSKLDGSKRSGTSKIKRLTFTGIQVLDPEVLEFIPGAVFSSIIDCYKKLLSLNKKICAFISKGYYWKDLGTPERYRQAVYEKMAPEAFRRAFPRWRGKKISRTELGGDGSDRRWYRIAGGGRSLVLSDHGLRKDDSTCEADAFVAVGHHLKAKGIPVPEIYLSDTVSGYVFMEDLGDNHLQALVSRTRDQNKIISYYRSLIEDLGELSLTGGDGFDPAWTYQTAFYSKDLIIEKECRYFVDAFLKGYLGRDVRFEDLEADFRSLADRTLEFAVNGFMHRDMQSRNIMVKNHRFYVIDFQGGRLGPVQYDLASLIIDPYVTLPRSVQDTLLKFGVETLSSKIGVEPHHFLHCYRHCAVTRNLQILGAFGFLSRIKKKTTFEKYIPAAVRSLKHNLSDLENTELAGLKTVVDQL